jgi:pyruvate dehydrogenase E2 component (dihydrolipoamide acetyltransferase)
MPIDILMPALSPTMEEGNLAKWLVKEGDTVKSGDVIAEIETDKATMEVEAVDEGTVAKIVVPAGTEGVKVNSLIAVLAGEGEDASAAAKAPTAPTPAPAAPPAAPAVTAPPASVSAPMPASSEKGARVFATPLARRIAADTGIDIGALAGSGPKGRIVKADVLNAKEKGVAPAPKAVPAAPAPSAPAPKPMSDDAVLKLFDEDSYHLVPHDNMRKVIARRLVEAKSTIPHFYLTVDCELDALLALRTQLNDAAPTKKTEKADVPVYKLSVNDMIIKALALALRDVPDANVSWTEAAMVKHHHCDVGVAVSIPGGLITPVVRRAEEKSLSAISNEMKDMAARAKARKLKPEEYQGGSSAVSNLGMMGVKNFAAVINPPHATILAVGAGEQRAVVKSGELKVATVMTVTLSTDHRCVDGALGAELLAAFRRYIENPLGMLV